MNHRTSLPKIMKTVPLTNTVKQSPLLCSFFLIPLILACFALSPTIQAGQIVLNPSSVIGGSGCYPGSAWNTPGNQFNAFQVVDNQNATGSINETFGNGYWLGKDVDFQEYFIVDLGAVYNLESVNLFNTHNGPAFDRASGDFQIYVSNAVIPNTSPETGAGGMDLSDATLAIGGMLTMPDNPILAQTFLFPPVPSRVICDLMCLISLQANPRSRLERNTGFWHATVRVTALGTG